MKVKQALYWNPITLVDFASGLRFLPIPKKAISVSNECPLAKERLGLDGTEKRFSICLQLDTNTIWRVTPNRYCRYAEDSIWEISKDLVAEEVWSGTLYKVSYTLGNIALTSYPEDKVYEITLPFYKLL